MKTRDSIKNQKNNINMIMLNKLTMLSTEQLTCLEPYFLLFLLPVLEHANADLCLCLTALQQGLETFCNSRTIILCHPNKKHNIFCYYFRNNTSHSKQTLILLTHRSK